MVTKVYITTPDNSWKEATLEEKRKAAYWRMIILNKVFAEIEHARIMEYHSAFDDDIAPLNVELTKKMFGYELPSEAAIVGKCVQRVIECDIVVFDYGWTSSKRCKVEHQTAFEYGKEIYTVNCNAGVFQFDRMPF